MHGRKRNCEPRRFHSNSNSNSKNERTTSRENEKIKRSCKEDTRKETVLDKVTETKVKMMHEVNAVAAGVGEMVLAAPQAALRPFEELEQAGSAANPIRFPKPQFFQAHREDNVLAFNGGKQILLNDVLIRDSSGASRAYWKIPGKSDVKTRMGHIEFRHVLTRNATNDNNNAVVFEMTKESVAIKVNYCDRMEELRGKFAEDPLSEIAAMQLLGTDCPHVIGCEDVLFDGESLCVVMPHVSGGDLFELIDERRDFQPDGGGGLPEEQCRGLFRQLLLGLRHLQSKGICHRDLSPENVMIGDEGSLIIDMGMCLWCPYTDPADPTGLAVTTKGTNGASQRRLIRPQGQCGKLPYMSKEIYLNRTFDGFAVDMWTTGTILFFMLTGYSYSQPLDPIFQCMTEQLPELLEGWSIHLSDDAVDLLQHLISTDPRQRFSLEEAMSHSWLNGPEAALGPMIVDYA